MLFFNLFFFLCVQKFFELYFFLDARISTVSSGLIQHSRHLYIPHKVLNCALHYLEDRLLLWKRSTARMSFEWIGIALDIDISSSDNSDYLIQHLYLLVNSALFHIFHFYQTFFNWIFYTLISKQPFLYSILGLGLFWTTSVANWLKTFVNNPPLRFLRLPLL